MTLQQAINHYGTKSKLARALKVTPQAVNYWGDEIPIIRQYQIQVLTRGKLKADK